MQSSEHDNIWCGFESADMSAGETFYGQQIMTSNKGNRGGGLCWRCHNYCDGTSRHLNFWGPHNDLRNDNGSCLNIRKSKAIVAGSWDRSINVLDRPHCQEIIILGVRFTSTVARSGNVTWLWSTGKVKTPERNACVRYLCLKQLIQYVDTFLLYKIIHTAQIFSAPKKTERQILTSISW